MLAFGQAVANAADPQRPRVNSIGAPIRDAGGQPINYGAPDLAAANPLPNATKPAIWRAKSMSTTTKGPAPAVTIGSQPFWQYPIWGSGIGVSNIVIAPAAAGEEPEIVVGGSSGSNFGGNDFWQSVRRTSSTGNYDAVFVSPLYTAAIKRIALANVQGNSDLELVVVLGDGRIYVYDFATKTDLGYIDTQVFDFEGLSLTDLDSDGYAELIVTTANDLFVANGATGALLWSVAGVGGYDVVVGKMDNDAALEIATTSGKVVDAATHAIQWTRVGGFGRTLELAPFPGESYQQLIAAESWEFVYAYDVGRQLPRWSIHTSHDIGALNVADVNNDGTPEVIIGDGQWGSVHVHDLITQAVKWEVSNPEHGVTNIAVGDVDGDSVVDLLWGAGWSSSGSDYLYVANTTAPRAINWQSFDLQGPFLGPLIGDLDGDGESELVVCSRSSESGYSSGRILVFDYLTLTLRGISAPVVENSAWTGVHDLKLRDLEGDGRMEIVLAAAYLYDGAIEVYGFDSSNTFTLEWTNTTRPSGSPFNFVEVADLDGNGTREIIAGNSVAHTGSEGIYVYIYDYPSGSNPWRSVNMANGFGAVTGLVVQDLDGNGSKEIAALVGGGDLYTFDGPSRQLRSLRQSTGFTLLGNRASLSRLVVGADNSGVGHFWRYTNNSYTESFAPQLGNGSLEGIDVRLNGALWTGSGGFLELRLPPYNTVTWQSLEIGAGFGRTVATSVFNGQDEVYSSAQHAVMGFTFQQPAPPAGDFNGDRLVDFLLINPSTRRTAIWELEGSAFLSSAYGPTVPVGWTVVGVADVDRDRASDYVLFNASTGRTAVWFLEHNTLIASAYGPTLPAGWHLMAVADINNNGTPDFVLFNTATRRTVIWFMNGTNLGSSAYGPTLPAGWALSGVADFNGDSKPDLLLQRDGSRQTALWYLNGTTYTGSAYGPTLPAGWTLQGAAEFNSDGKPDYVLLKTSTRQTALWFLNGAAQIGSAYGPTLAAGYVLAAP